MDKEWIKLPRYSSEYIDGVEFFLNYAYTNGKPQGGEIMCPCAKCHNTCWEVMAIVYDHLIGYGFQKGYDVWVRHGEVLKDMDLDGCMNDDNDSVDDIEGLLCDTFRDAAEDNELNNGLNDDAKIFYNLIEEAQQELYPAKIHHSRCRKKTVFAILNDAWRRHKCVIKEEHFSKYKTTYEHLKNRPKDIPESHFKELIRYWSLGNIKEMSEQNSKNKAHQKWRHRTGPVNFGVIRERLTKQERRVTGPRNN
ncbi:putative transposase, Ptta/En/Spm, plant, Transposase-associated domain-containing protein [Lupinus albus]|uniref:Putative transposase, Ptta/En/Spm, plant, Transposase-associated domain-containing protein n=1 Tax=Lupinus albus TaxID=3870 RepID=A0A6A4NWR1_LUPAL|nr:putative transposase, Ptta/En/Spm, plant, Transposase-associated domain-containing protein [Lupinus albus]